MSPTEPSTLPARPHVAGHLFATCEQDDNGKSILSRKDFKTPIHISKPYWDGHSLLLNLMCPTAGLLADDSVDLKISVKPHAALTLSNPSSLRIHKMAEDRQANWTQSFTVGKSAYLESNPEWLILQGESSFTQRSAIELDEGAELFFIEPIAAGRIAHGESFAFRRFRNRLSLRYDGQLAFLEKHAIEPHLGTADSWNAPFQTKLPFYVSILLVSDKLTPNAELWKSIHALQNADLQIGSSLLAHGPCWSIKLLSRSPIVARKTVAQIRELFYAAIGRTPTALRRQ